jgi:pilus assembly protein CpaF
MLASAIHITVHMNRLNDGSRKVTGISEVRGVERDHVILDDIFVFEREGITSAGRALGTFRGTGHVPLACDRLKAYGINLPKSIFQELVEVRST